MTIRWAPHPTHSEPHEAALDYVVYGFNVAFGQAPSAASPADSAGRDSCRPVCARLRENRG